MWPFKENFKHALKSSHSELSIAASPASLRLSVRELGRGGGQNLPPASGARSAENPSGARVNWQEVHIHFYQFQDEEHTKTYIFSIRCACHFAAKIFGGGYGSRRESELEQELDMLEAKRARIMEANFKVRSHAFSKPPSKLFAAMPMMQTMCQMTGDFRTEFGDISGEPRRQHTAWRPLSRSQTLSHVHGRTKMSDTRPCDSCTRHYPCCHSAPPGSMWLNANLRT